MPSTQSCNTGTPGPSSSPGYAARPAMVITGASKEPLTIGPVTTANGLPVARKHNPFTNQRLSNVLRMHENLTGIRGDVPGG